jgi:urease accessory protein
VVARALIRTAAGHGGGTRLETLRSDPPLTLRQTGRGRIHLVSTGAGPLGGDRMALSIDVAPGTALEVRSVGATLVLPGAVPPVTSPAPQWGRGRLERGESVMVVHARVGAGASLRFSPEPTVLAAGCFHRIAVRLSLAQGATVFWREEVVFGRHGERPGRCHTRFDATVAGHPLLRQDLVVGDVCADDSPAVYGQARCVGSTLIAGPGWAATAAPEGKHGRAAVTGEGWAALPLAGPGVLSSALAADAVQLRTRLEQAEEAALRMARGGMAHDGYGPNDTWPH